MPTLLPRTQQVVRMPRKELPKSTETSPTLSALLSERDRSAFMDITIPLTARISKRAKYQPIQLNKVVFEPGKSYKVHPLVHAELSDRIEQFERSIYLQINPENDAGIPVFDGELFSEPAGPK